MAATDAPALLGNEDLLRMELRVFAQKTLRMELEDFGLRLQSSMCEELQRFLCGHRASSGSPKSPCRPLLAPLASKGVASPVAGTLEGSPVSVADSAVEEPAAPGIAGHAVDAIDSALPGSPDSATASEALRRVSAAVDGSPSPPGKKTGGTPSSRRRSRTSAALPTEAFDSMRDFWYSQEEASRRTSCRSGADDELNLPGCVDRSQRARAGRRRSSPISRSIRSRSNSDVEQQQLPTFIGFKPASGERSVSLSRSSTVGLEMSPGVGSQRRSSRELSPDIAASRRKGCGRSQSQSGLEADASMLTSAGPSAQDAGAPESEDADGPPIRAVESASGFSNVTSSPETPFYQVRRWVFLVVESPKFDWSWGVLVCLNAISIGWQTDYMARHSADHPPMVFRVLDVFFCFVFALEISLRALAYGRHFFMGDEWRWNLFDVATVAMQIFEEVTALVAMTTEDDHSTGSNFSYLRLLRLVRLVRVLRIVRVLRFIGELRRLVCSIGNSLQSLAWTIVLLVFMLYVVGVCFTQLVSNHMRYTPHMTSNEALLHEHFGSLGSSVLSLFQAMSGGVDWEELARPMRDVHWTLELLFALYIAFAVLAMLNVVTGVFVDSAVQSSTKDQENDFVYRMRELYNKTNLNGDGRLTWGAFEHQLQKKDVAEYFQNVGINITEAKSLFELLDVHDSGEIDADEFVMGCLRLRGPAKSVDLVTLMYDNKRLLGKLHLQFQDAFRVMQADLLQFLPAPRRPLALNPARSSFAADVNPTLSCSTADGRRSGEP